MLATETWSRSRFFFTGFCHPLWPQVSAGQWPSCQPAHSHKYLGVTGKTPELLPLSRSPPLANPVAEGAPFAVEQCTPCMGLSRAALFSPFSFRLGRNSNSSSASVSAVAVP